jgi:hypothetical protein
MPLWTLDTPPTFYPEAELTKQGWLDSTNGELLVAMQGEEDRVGPGTGLQRCQTGKARIQTTNPKQQAGGAAIQNTTAQTQPGISRFQVTFDASQVGGADIQNTTVRPQIGNTSVRNTTIQTQLANSTVQVTTQQTQLGSAVIAYTINLPNLLVEYGFYEGSNPTTIKDLSGNGIDGTLSAPGVYTNLGLRLDGSQYITSSNIPLIAGHMASTSTYTVFAIVQPETLDTSDDVIAVWGEGGTDGYYKLRYNTDIGFAVDLQVEAWTGKFFPTVNVPFVVVQRYNPTDQQLDTRLSVNSNVATKVGIYDLSEEALPKFIGDSGLIGNIRGTMIYFALLQGDITNGQMGHLFKFAHNLLLVRGPNPLV